MNNTEQWTSLIKTPYDIDGDNNDGSPENMHSMLSSRNTNNSINPPGSTDSGSGSDFQSKEYPLPDDNFENFNPMMDINIEDFLTKELKDLDIPMLPKNELSKLDLDMFPNSDLSWNVVNDNDTLANSGNINGTNDNSGITPRKLMPGQNQNGYHRKQPSGTAIFGFSQHNKSLSIGAMTINVDETKKAMMQRQQQESEQPDIKMNETLMQQQRELQMALQRQKEMNEKLEEQLRMNKLQQEQLQRALEAQQMTLEQVSSIPANATPVRPDTSIIVTSNGKNGKYQFPPRDPVNPSANRPIDKSKPNMEYEDKNNNGNGGRSSRNNNNGAAGNGLLSPFSRASINGSPHRRRNHNYDNIEPGNNNLTLPINFSISSTSTVGNSSEQMLKMSKYFRELTDDGKQRSSSLSSSNNKSSSRSPITPQDQIYDNPKTPSLRCNHTQTCRSDDGTINPKNNNTDTGMNENIDTGSSSSNNHASHSSSNINQRRGKHAARDSTVSTASTIPMQGDDDQCSQTYSPQQPHLQQSSVGLGLTLDSRLQLKKPPQLQMLPTIPGSSETTPLKSKQSPQRPSQYQTNNMPVKHSFQHTPTKELIFNNAPNISLQPENNRRHSQTLGSGLSQQQQQMDDDEPEFKFVQAQTPSPILRSQERFDCIAESPVHLQYHHNNQLGIGSSSPAASGGRNGKRYGMLPREEIDKYILELGPKQFQCKFKDCQKMFNRRYNARTHIQTHLCDRPYKCDYPGCQKAFVRNHDLLRHKKSHLDKMYSCGGCDKRFHSEDALTKHQERKGHEGKYIAGEDEEEDDDAGYDYGYMSEGPAHILSSPVRGNQIRKPVSPKKVPNTIRENIQRDHTGAALRMQEQLNYH